MKSTLTFTASASLNYQKYDATITLELAEGEKLTAADKEKYQKYVNEVASIKVTELAKMIEEAKTENPELNVDKKVVPTPMPTPVPTPTAVPGVDPLASLKAMSGGQNKSGDWFVRAGNHTLGEANEKELRYIAGLTSKSYASVAGAAQALLNSGFTGV